MQRKDQLTPPVESIELTYAHFIGHVIKTPDHEGGRPWNEMGVLDLCPMLFGSVANLAFDGTFSTKSPLAGGPDLSSENN